MKSLLPADHLLTDCRSDRTLSACRILMRGVCLSWSSEKRKVRTKAGLLLIRKSSNLAISLLVMKLRARSYNSELFFTYLA